MAEKIRIACSKEFTKAAAEKYKQISDELIYEYLPPNLHQSKISKPLKVWLKYSDLSSWNKENPNWELLKYSIWIEYKGHIQSHFSLMKAYPKDESKFLDFVKQYHALKGVGYTWEDWEKHIPLSNLLLGKFPSLRAITCGYFINMLAKRNNMLLKVDTRKAGTLTEWELTPKDSTIPAIIIRKIADYVGTEKTFYEEFQCFTLADNPFQELSPLYSSRGFKDTPDYDRFMLDLRRQIVQMGKWAEKNQ